MLIILMGILTLLVSVAMNANSGSLKNRSGIEIGFGFREDSGLENEHTVFNVVNRTSIENMTFSLGFNHWIEENVAFNLSISVIDSENRTGIDEFGVYDYNYAVVPIMAGFRFYPNQSRNHSNFRPFISMAMGPVIRSSNYDYVGHGAYNETYTETVFGGKVGAGVDIIMGKHMLLGFDGSYNHYSDFDSQFGLENVYNGPEFGIRFGFVFGGPKAPENSRGITRVHH
jgi:hypothetical protein